jgi:hypothetical protein
MLFAHDRGLAKVTVVTIGSWEPACTIACRRRSPEIGRPLDQLVMGDLRAGRRIAQSVSAEASARAAKKRVPNLRIASSRVPAAGPASRPGASEPQMALNANPPATIPMLAGIE